MEAVVAHLGQASCQPVGQADRQGINSGVRRNARANMIALVAGAHLSSGILRRDRRPRPPLGRCLGIADRVPPARRSCGQSNPSGSGSAKPICSITPPRQGREVTLGGVLTSPGPAGRGLCSTPFTGHPTEWMC